MTPSSAVTDGADGADRSSDPHYAAIRVEGLTKRYGGRSVLDGVSMEVRRGELVALLGPNGAGKTTTVEIVEGYRRPEAGTVRVLGRDPARGGPVLRARVGLMLQDGGFDPRAEPRETLIQFGRFHQKPRRPDELIDLVGLRTVARTRYRRLSGGERRRLALAVALVGRPDVLVLDEPTAGMDPEARVATRAIVAEQRASGAAILLTSHDLGDVERMADRVAILVAGRIVAQGSPADLVARARPHLRFRLDAPLDAVDETNLERSLSDGPAKARVIAETTAASYRIDGVVPDAPTIARLASWCAAAGRLIVELRAGSGTLEEAYLELARAAGAPGTDDAENADISTDER